MLEPLPELKLAGHPHTLSKGVEFSAQPHPGARRRRMRYTYARLTPKGYEVTAWTGQRTVAVRADQIVEVHRTRKLPKSPESFRPPARGRGR